MILSVHGLKLFKIQLFSTKIELNWKWLLGTRTGRAWGWWPFYFEL